MPEKDLPVKLPDVKSYQPTGTGESPLAAIESWVNTTCPKCGGKAKRETNTMPQWGGSCWYYLRYLDPKNNSEFCSKEKEEYWMPVDLYVGGAEHAVLHLLYARFWHKVLYDIGAVSTKEPFHRLINQGLITSFAFQRKNKTLVPTDEVEEKDGKYFEKATGEQVEQIIAKMSKSLNTQGLVGINRFLEKVWNISEKPMDEIDIKGKLEDKALVALRKTFAQTIKKVTEDTSSLSFNTAISQMMIFINEASKFNSLPKEMWKDFVLILSPYAPHLGEELWQKLGGTKTVAYEKWPSFSEEFCKEDSIQIVVMINGKLRDKFEAAPGTDDETLKNLASQTEGYKKFTDGKTIAKVIVVKDKLVNIVAK